MRIKRAGSLRGRSSTYRLAGSTLAIVALGCAVSEAAVAEETLAANDVLGTVVVSARNREEVAQDVPLPVQVIGGKQLERDGVQSIWDLPEKVPNLQLNPPGENARKVSPSIRGIGRNGANDSAEGSVGTIVDGVTLYYSGQAWADYVDLDRIEVLRGPQGTLMGKNTTLGAINIVTKLPSFTPSSTFEIASGNLNSIKGKFSSTGAIIDDLLAFRGTFVVDRVSGLYTNTYQSFGQAKETWNESNKVGGRVQLLLTPTANISNRIILDKLRSDERVNLGFQWDDGPATWSDGVPRTTSYLKKFAARSAYFHNADGTPYQPLLGLRSFENAEARPQITDQWGVSDELQWRVAGHTLTSITAYRYQDFDIKNGGNTRYYIGNSGQQLWNKQLSEELRLTSDPGRKIDYQAGLYYLKARVHSDDPTYNGPDSGAFNASDAQFNRLIQTAGGKQLLVDSLNGIYQSEVTDAKVRSVALYGQADWHITDKGTLTAGVRQTDEHKTNRFEQQVDRPGLPLTAANYPVVQGYTAQNLVDANAIRTARIRTPTGFIDGDPIDDSLTAWTISPSYKLTPDVLLYASVGEGVKSGFIYFDVGQAPTSPTFETTIKPEKSRDYELGVKTLLLNRTVQLNANLYLTDVTDYQTSLTVIDPDGITVRSQWTNAPGVKARGLELEAAYYYGNGLSFNASGAYNDAFYNSQWLIVKPEIDTSLPQYSGINVRNRFIDLEGEQLTGVPKVTFNVGSNYEFPVGNWLGRVTLTSSYRSSTNLNSNHAAFSEQDAYVITNLGLGISTSDRRYELSLLGRNIFDEFYATSKSTYTSTGASSLQLGAPRYWEIVFRARL